MNFNLKNYQDQLLFIPLGGCNDIGANLSVYHLAGKLLIVDMGIGFTSEHPGVDVLIPDISFLKANREKIVGLIVTHIHEDHCGAIEYLWNELQMPIFASKFTLNFIRSKLADYEFSGNVKMTEIGDHDLLKLRPFNIKLVNMAHSTPESRAVFIQTEKGNILHTGDWKFDETPNEAGERTDLEYLAKIVREGRLDAVVADSTNAIVEGTVESETSLFDSLKQIISLRKGAVAVSTFASNLSRVQTLLKIAQELGRKVVLSGFALNRIVSIAKQSGYLQGLNKVIIPDNQIKHYRREELLFICTGCQGETNASTYKLAKNVHPYLKLLPGDTVIFSSKIIPGNEKGLASLFNDFALHDIEVVSEVGDFVHVSGHAKRQDMRKMYNLLHPAKFIAVHGSPHQIMQNVLLAKEVGIQDTFKAHNGAVVLLERGLPMQELTTLEVCYRGLDGNRIIVLDNAIIRDRKQLANAGAISVSVVVDEHGRPIAKPVIYAPGFFDFAEDPGSEEALQDLILEGIEQSTFKIAKGDNRNTSIKPEELATRLQEKLRTILLKAAKQENNKKPELLIAVHVL